MKKVSLVRALLALGLATGAALEVNAQAPSLLPIPQARAEYGVQPTAHVRRFQAEEAGSGLAPANGPLEAAPGAPADNSPFTPYEAALGGAWSDGSEGSCGCGVADACCQSCLPCTCWWVTGRGLWMGRDNEDFEQLSFDTTNPAGSVLSTDSANMNWSGGFEARLGRWFNCGSYGVEVVYWGLFPSTQEETILGGGLAGSLNTVFDFGDISINGVDVNTLYDNAEAHRVRRSWQFHNIELNLLQGYGYSCDSFDVSFLGGVRYFRFDEGFQYASAVNSPIFGADPLAEGYYEIDVENHLIGVQLGATGNAYVGNKLRFYGTPKVGLFNNHINHTQRIFNASGVGTVNPLNPFAGAPYDINSSKNDVTFMAEIDLGIDYRFSNHWSFNVGYRAVALTGVALATSQIPRDFADIDGARDINNDESLILHGAYAGATFSW